MIHSFKEHIQQNFPFLENSKFIIAVSGGIDSVVLSHLMSGLNLNFAICHCNFKLREKESDDDETFVKKLAKHLDVPFYNTSFSTQKFADENKLSIQVAARDLRYKWFYELIEKHAYDYVLTAHNSNDNLETFIINLTRGSGLEGFTGIPPINKKTIRPLLTFSRDDIRFYAIKNSISWREDRSNTNVKYIRNKVRHKIIPVLQEINPNLLDSFKNTLSHLQESQQIIDESIEKISERIVSKNNGYISLSVSKINKLHHKKAYLYQLLQSYGFTEWNDILDLLSAQSGKHVFSKTHRLLKDRNELILTEKFAQVEDSLPIYISENQLQITHPISLQFEKTENAIKNSNDQILVDKDLLNYPLSLRKWIYGDYICPTGMTGKKKLSQLFKDHKLSLLAKENIWILTDAKDTIIWVIGLRQDRRFAVTENTQNRVLISCK